MLGIAPGLPEQGGPRGPVGDAAHGLVSVLGVVPTTVLFDSLTGLIARTGGLKRAKPLGDREWTADALAGGGVR